jgi:mono/diheme cytochrome c family protein
VAATPPANTVPFPLDVRALQAGWKMLFFRPEPYRPNPARSEEWNRGAYLAEGLTHCGACHTPRNVLGAESVGHPYNGAIVDREWVAWPLDVSVSPARWTTEEFVTYLKGGTTVHGRAHGPMGPVVNALKVLPDSDIAAIAGYFASLNRPQSSKAEALTRQVLARSRDIARHEREPGRQLYLAACASCHDDGGTTPLATRAILSLNTALWYDRPNNFVLTVLNGVGTPDDAPGPLMPPFRDSLTDTEIVAIAGYLRGVRLHLPNWPASEYNKVDRFRDHPLADDAVKIRTLPAD